MLIPLCIFVGTILAWIWLGAIVGYIESRQGRAKRVPK